jgi:signal transduction histidine kinase
MVTLTEELYSAGHKLFDIQVERLIVALRVVLASFTAIAFFVSPIHTDVDTDVVVLILLGYAVFGIVVVGLTVIARGRTGWQLPVHFVDTGIIALLMHFLEGISNTSFLLYTFLLLGATVRWNWRGAVWTAVSLLGLEVILIWELGPSVNANLLMNTLIQAAFLLVLAGMFAFFGATRESIQRRLVELAAWPGTTDKPDRPNSLLLEGPLAHISSVLQAPRVIVVWTILDEPFLDVALWGDGKYRQYRKQASDLGDWTAPELRKLTFASAEVSSGRFFSLAASRIHSGPLLAESLQKEFEIRSVACAPFVSKHCAGRIFMLDKSHWSEDDLTMIEIVASRMGVELEQYALRLQLADTIAVVERSRLARDLHDGLLQGLTAAGLQLKALASLANETAKSTISDVLQLLFQEQRRIRLFLEDKQSLIERLPLGDELQQVVEQNARKWGCAVPFTVTPQESTIRPELFQQLDLILTEGIANAVRHGKASRVDVTVRKSSDHVQLLIKDNGHGVKDRTGVYSQAELAAANWGPVSIRSRVAELKGSFILASSPRGVELQIELPG